MKQRLLFVPLLLLSWNVMLTAQVTLIATSGTTLGSYATLGEAFAKINDGTHRGEISISLEASTTEGSSAILVASESGSANYTSVIIYPAVNGITVFGNFASPLIDLNGADNVIIDGRVNATGSSISMVISNASHSDGSTSTIRFRNDATYNTVKYCRIMGSSGFQAGILWFGNSSAGTSGNSYNTIDHNEISSYDVYRPHNVILSTGTSSSVMNSNNAVSNNNIHDFFRSEYWMKNATFCINLSTGGDDNGDGYNTAWTIAGNSFYQTTAYAPIQNLGHNVIYIFARSGNNFTISNNYIGGSAPECNGTWIKTNSTSNTFWAMQIKIGTETASNIQGNTIKNFKYYNNGGVDWWGIYIDWGAVNIGTTEPNIIGSASDTGSIFYSCGGPNARFLAMHLQGDGYCNTRNNVIGSITTANTNPAYATSFWGIHQQTRYSVSDIFNNTIGSTTTPNSIKALSASTSNAQSVIGFSGDGNDGTVTFSNNTIANLTNGTTNTNPGTQGKIYGIYILRCTNTISGNTIHDLTIANANTATGPDPNNLDNTSLDAAGIAVANPSNHIQTITGNTVYNISNTFSSFAGYVAGIYIFGQNTVSTIDKNFIYGLNISPGSPSASVFGIRIASGATICSNNILMLGGNNPMKLYGIYETGGSSYYPNSIYFNTVYLSGSPASDAQNSYGLYSAISNNTRDFRNNIFDNARSNNGASGRHYAMYVQATGGNLNCDNNDYVVSGSGGMVGYYGGDKSVLPIVTGVTGNDAASVNQDPLFANAGGTTPESYRTGADLTGVTGTGITTDYEESPRGPFPSMGAYEAPSCTNPSSGGVIDGSQVICSGNVPVAFTSSLPPSGYTGILEYKWQSSVIGASEGFGDIETSNSESYAPGALSTNTWYRRLARVTCMENWTGAVASNVLEITINAVSVGGSIAGSASVCVGSSSTILTLSGHTGSVLMWQSTTNNWVDITDISNATTTLTATNLTATTSYRAVVKSGVCEPVYSAVATVTVEQTAASGSLAKTPVAMNVCEGTDVSALFSPGMGGSGTDIVEYRTKTGTEWSGWATYISGTTILTSDLSGVEIQTYREADYCEDAETVTIGWIIDPATVPGTVTGGMTVCYGLNSTLLSLSGHLGSVLRWEWSTNNSDWNVISNTSDTFTATNLIADTWFRAVVKSGVCGEENSDATQITMFTDYHVSGYAKYFNNPKTPLNQLKITLKKSGVTQGSPVVTGTNGYFDFGGLTNGTYDLEVTSAHQSGEWQTWNGVNNTDYLLVSRHATGVAFLTTEPPVVRKTADVIAPQSPPVINTLDANAVKNAAKYGWFKPNTSTPWFDIPKWTFSGTTSATSITGFELSCSNLTRDIYGLCAGDVNGSYIPPNGWKQAEPSLELVHKGTLTLNGEMIFPVRAGSEMEIGAITLMLNFDPEIMEIYGVEMSETKGQKPYFIVNGNQLQIGWMSLEPLNVVEGETVLMIKVRMSNVEYRMLNIEPLIRFTLNDSPLSELADAEGNVMDGAKMAIPDASHQSPVTTHEDLLSVYPNPVSDILNIEYLMEKDGIFQANLVNMHGVVLVTGSRHDSKAGLNKVTINLGDTPNGVCFLKVAAGDQRMTVKVLVNR